MADVFRRKNERKCYEKYIYRQVKKKLGNADASSVKRITER